ncbi:20742_t:CDS:1, partial [Rhizophagus irregularis]
IVKEGKKRVIGKQGDRSEVEDEEDDEGEWTRYRGKGRGKIRGVVVV